MQRILIATGNPGKIREIADALRPTGIEAVGLEQLDDRSEVEETGTTFEANARLKAEQYSLRTDLPVLADDSGIEVDALDGAPGVYSARFGGPGLDDPGRCGYLLEQIAGVEEPERRSARFRCVVALARGGRTLATFEGVVEGRLLTEPRGENGFGYDPIFFHPPSGCTTAQLTTTQKQRISHRGEAIAALIEAIRAGDPRLANLG